jgi:hypothetical protein
VTWLDRGDVLLLEEQRSSGLPVDTIEIYHSLIQLATMRGIVVVEPAGNGAGQDISYLKSHDSGALVVGAASLRDGQWRPFSTHGTRVDCFGPATGFVAAGYGPGERPSNDPRVTTRQFPNTSLASALMAGVVAVVQGLHLAKTGDVLGPGQIREYFRGSENDRREARKRTEDQVELGWLPQVPTIYRRLFGAEPPAPKA